MNKKEDIKKRLNKIKGQLNGIDKMLDDCRDIIDIINQISAARAALSKVGVDLLQSESELCLNSNKQEDKKRLDKIIAQLFKIT